MSEHPNVARLRDAYAAFARGDFAALNDLFADDVLSRITGRNQVQGDYRGRDAGYGLFGKFMEVTEGTFRIDVHAVLADDAGGVALAVVTGSVADRSATTNHAHTRMEFLPFKSPPVVRGSRFNWHAEAGCAA
jgi:uncharacterized protein